MLLSAACRGGDKSGADTAGPAPKVGAKTIVVEPQAFSETLGSIGNVAPRVGHIASLSAPAAGRVGKMLVSIGQSVHAGDALIELDQAPFQATLQSAAATLRAADQASERQQRLAQEGIVPRKDAEQAAADAARAKADETAAQRALDLSVLKSPIDGVVTRLSATLGASVDPSSPIVEIADPSLLDIVFNVTPTDAARVHPGAKVTLSAGETAGGEPLGIGDVMSVSGTVDSASRSVSVRVQASATRRPLRIGETVFGAIGLAMHPSAIVIPNEALVPDGENVKVFVVDAGGVAHEREVTIGGKGDAGVEVLEGLKAGERIVTYGAYGMQDSAKVVPLGAPPGQSKAAAGAKGDAKPAPGPSGKPDAR
ncbi:MAG TPA: efflux RND transporter periplasmic adaptor subunit [Gemmatimonadaceae bacterium]|nr:efflux RND transporter periplasmic adaptor subunit [Gemmatimonadaceae bacterium]